MDPSSGIFSLAWWFANQCVLHRPGFRDSAFQPFKREEEGGEEKVREEMKQQEEQQECNEAEDSEGDEMVDIERIEDKEEDPATTTQAKV